MTTGIYKLVFEGTNMVYIGQSLNIELRYKQHLSSLRCQISSIKLQAAYTLYGTPTLEIFEECTESELDAYEDSAIEVFNSVEHGFNTCSESGTRTSLHGDSNPGAKYSNTQIAEVLDLLVTTSYPQGKIAELTGVSKQCVNHISNGHKHLWLETSYPEKYAKLVALRGTRKSGQKCAKDRGILYPKIVHPISGEVYEVDNTNEFSRTHELDNGGLGKLLNYKLKSHKGWKRLEN